MPKTHAIQNIDISKTDRTITITFEPSVKKPIIAFSGDTGHSNSPVEKAIRQVALKDDEALIQSKLGDNLYPQGVTKPEGPTENNIPDQLLSPHAKHLALLTMGNHECLVVTGEEGDPQKGQLLREYCDPTHNKYPHRQSSLDKNTLLAIGKKEYTNNLMLGLYYETQYQGDQFTFPIMHLTLNSNLLPDDEDQFIFLVDKLKKAKAKNQRVIISLHHPLEDFGKRKTTTDGPKYAALAKKEADASLITLKKNAEDSKQPQSLRCKKTLDNAIIKAEYDFRKILIFCGHNHHANTQLGTYLQITSGGGNHEFQKLPPEHLNEAMNHGQIHHYSPCLSYYTLQYNQGLIVIECYNIQPSGKAELCSHTQLNNNEAFTTTTTHINSGNQWVSERVIHPSLAKEPSSLNMQSKKCFLLNSGNYLTLKTQKGNAITLNKTLTQDDRHAILKKAAELIKAALITQINRMENSFINTDSSIKKQELLKLYVQRIEMLAKNIVKSHKGKETSINTMISELVTNKVSLGNSTLATEHSLEGILQIQRSSSVRDFRDTTSYSSIKTLLSDITQKATENVALPLGKINLAPNLFTRHQIEKTNTSSGTASLLPPVIAEYDARTVMLILETFKQGLESILKGLDTSNPNSRASQKIEKRAPSDQASEKERYQKKAKRLRIILEHGTLWALPVDRQQLLRTLKEKHSLYKHEELDSHQSAWNLRDSETKTLVRNLWLKAESDLDDVRDPLSWDARSILN